MPGRLDLDSTRTALLCLDFQRAIVADAALGSPDPEVVARFEGALAQAAHVLAAARRAGARVVHVRVALAPDDRPRSPLLARLAAAGALAEGAPSAELDPRLAPAPGEPVVTKRAVSAFAGTELARLLAAWGVETLLLTGLVTHLAVEGTARDGADRGYRVVVAADACASEAPARHEAALVTLRELGQVVPTAHLVSALGSR